VSEEFGVDGSFRYGAAVDGEILFSTAWRVVVNDAWNNLLSNTTFADDEYGQVSRRYLQGNVQRMIQSLAVAYDAVSLLDSL